MSDIERPIGLAISGSGHKAVLFALGALLYLTDSGANKRVRTIASASGGSLINAFLALLGNGSPGENGKSFNDLSPSEFERFAARFAKRVSGRPTWWWTIVSLYGACLLTWLLLTWIALPNSITFFWQLLFVVPLGVLSIAGQFSGGIFWGSWISWFYAGSIIYGVALGILAFCAALLADPEFWKAGAVLILGSAIGFSCRTWVSEMSLAEAICSAPGGKDLLSGIAPGLRHVFCATELGGGEKVFFSRDRVDVPAFGAGSPGKLRLSTAVQASANPRVLFPPLRLSTSKLGLAASPRPGRQRSGHLLLSDGGVGDELATSWYLKTETGSVEETPEQIVVINGSTPTPAAQAGRSWCPPLRELEGLDCFGRSVCRIETRRELFDLRTKFSSPKNGGLAVSGAIASMEESPCRAMSHYLGSKADGHGPAYPARESVDKGIVAAAHQALDLWRHGSGAGTARDAFTGETADIDRQVTSLKRQLWQYESELKGLARDSFEYRETYEAFLDVKKEIIRLDNDGRRQVAERFENHEDTLRSEQRVQEDAEIEEAVQKNARIRANFRPLGKSSTALLLWHGYLSMMINGNIFLRLPMIDRNRALADFRALAKGRMRLHASETEAALNPQSTATKLARASSLLGWFSMERLLRRHPG